ncbi:hypothetical protein JCM10213_000749 [Rhodosporidiobolus nylandii]
MVAPPLASAQHPALAILLPPVDAHPVRLASASSINAVVSFALGHLRQDDAPPLVLHCLPSASSSSASAAPTTSTPVIPAPEPPAPAPAKTSSSKSSADSSVAGLPKLVSIAEVIKREWFSVPLATSSAALPAPSPSLHARDEQKDEEQKREGLHQYTLLTTLEALKLADPERKGAKELEEDELKAQEEELVVMGWLTGKAGRAKRPRRKHTPTMLVVLSTSAIPSLSSSSSWTYQPPSAAPRAKRPSSDPDAGGGDDGAGEGGKKKRRRRRKARGKEAEDEGAAQGDGMDVDLPSGAEE